MRPFWNFDELEREVLEKATNLAPGDTVRALFSHRWLAMAGFIFVVGGLFQNTLLTGMAGFMLIITLCAWLWSRSALKRVIYLRRLRHRRAFPGEQLALQIHVENRKLLPLGWLHIEDPWEVNVGPADDTLLSRVRADQTATLMNGYTLRWYQRVKRNVALQARQRGIYEIGPAKALSGDPFSLFEREVQIAPKERLIVYPEIKTLAELGLPFKDPLGPFRVQQRLFEDPNRIMGVRDYHPTDGMRHVHWKATARTGALQTKVYEPTRSAQVVLCLNVATYEMHWRGVWPEMMEYLVTTVASLAAWGTEQGYAMGLAANGTLAHADQPFSLLPSQDRDQLMHLLEALAGVTYFVTADFNRFLLEESPGLPWGATLVLITSYLNNAIRATILRLRDSGRRMVLLALGKQPPGEILGVLTYHLPIQAQEPGGSTGGEGEVEETPRQRFLRQQAERETEWQQSE